MERKVALVLGGIVPHIELIRQLKAEGYYTILIDYLDNPPAKQFADEHVQESTLDKEMVLKIASVRKASLVISSCVDQANITACYVMEQMGLYVPYSYESAEKITNKAYMKKAMLENGIPTSKYIYIDNREVIPEINFDFPVMVKPADNNSSNGVKKAVNKSELEIYLQEALSISRNGRAIVEDFVTGKEISAYCFVQNNKAKLLMTAERLSVTEGDAKVIKCYASIAPAGISKEAEKNAEMVATRIAEVFGLDNTPLFFQGMVNGNDIKVIEFAPRVPGGIAFKTVYDNTGFDLIKASINSYLGRKVEYEYHQPKHLISVNTMYGKDSIYDCVTGQDELLGENIIEHIFYHKNSRAKLDNMSASKSRIGAFVVKADNEEEMYCKVDKAYNILDAFDINGQSILRRDLNICTQLKDIQ